LSKRNVSIYSAASLQVQTGSHVSTPKAKTGVMPFDTLQVEISLSTVFGGGQTLPFARVMPE